MRGDQCASFRCGRNVGLADRSAQGRLHVVERQPEGGVRIERRGVQDDGVRGRLERGGAARPVAFVTTADVVEDRREVGDLMAGDQFEVATPGALLGVGRDEQLQDRKSTRLNSSHMSISYAVFCFKKKKEKR